MRAIKRMISWHFYCLGAIHKQQFQSYKIYGTNKLCNQRKHNIAARDTADKLKKTYQHFCARWCLKH